MAKILQTDLNKAFHFYSAVAMIGTNKKFLGDRKK